MFFNLDTQAVEWTHNTKEYILRAAAQSGMRETNSLFDVCSYLHVHQALWASWVVTPTFVVIHIVFIINFISNWCCREFTRRVIVICFVSLYFSLAWSRGSYMYAIFTGPYSRWLIHKLTDSQKRRSLKKRNNIVVGHLNKLVTTQNIMHNGNIKTWEMYGETLQTSYNN